VKSCLRPTNFSTEATEYGIAKEGVAILKFEEQYNLHVQCSGLWVDEEHGFLGASPDGITMLANVSLVIISYLVIFSFFD
jgi:hypothetical protein